MNNTGKKIPVCILGATGMVGQKFLELLENHPQFEVVALAASEKSTGKKYGEIVNWQQDLPLPSKYANFVLHECKSGIPGKIAFSGLDSSVAGEIETDFAENGYIVISNSKNHRMNGHVPLLVPEVNHEHLELVKKQNFSSGGMIITNPNCSVVGLTMALKPLNDLWNVESVDVVTLQALSGAGYPGVPSMEIVDNIIPYISGEEEKIETEPGKILGTFSNGIIDFHSMKINAQCNRVCVLNGHLECMTVKLSKKATSSEIIAAWNNFRSPVTGLISSPPQLLQYFYESNYPQPRKQRHLGMTVSIGRLQEATFGRWKFVILSHNTVRGAAGGAILNAELVVRQGYL